MLCASFFIPSIGLLFIAKDVEESSNEGRLPSTFDGRAWPAFTIEP